MGSRGRAGLVCLVLGILCLTGALGLWHYNRSEAQEAEASARAVMALLAPEIEARATEGPKAPTAPEESGPEAEPDPQMPVVEIDGRAYIGFLTIPELSLELPVMAEWDYDRLKIAPCRYSGSLAGRDLTIAAHNYLRHFGRLTELNLGAEILFTDANGQTLRYTVAELEVLPPEAVEQMTAGDYDLTLFTCTYGGATRFTLRCLLAG